MRTILAILLVFSLVSCDSSKNDQLYIEGLKKPVEILRDKWGINHIYAKNQHDLFFAQGYAAAKDRLFQFEIWRRQATGTTAEILGEKELKRDMGARLFQFRGDLNQEFSHYHKDGIEIINAYTNGINAYIEEILVTPEKLPVEFKLLGITPEKWTNADVISRHQGLLGNITSELSIGRAVAKLGVKKVKDLSWFHPKDPDITLDPSINKELLFDDILELYNAFRRTVRFQVNDIQPGYRTSSDANALLDMEEENKDSPSIGSNNWVVGGALMADGSTYMANDPHRTISVPSLRYMTHLNAPGWNVIGGGEPEIPGISIGHNEYGSWGLTVFKTDGEDMYIYDLNPKNSHQYMYKGDWANMQIISETIRIKDQDDVTVDFFYTRHGPVVYMDTTHNKAYAIRCAWLEPGGSPYLASLRMNQATTWEEFREACNYSHIPGENMVWADRKGNIGWQAVGIAPIRENFSGLVPVPGDGRYEWEGYLPIIHKPNLLNPKEGFFATANQNVTSEEYGYWNAIGFNWADPFRGDRVNEILGSGSKMTMDDMKALQIDYLSIPARTLVPLLANLTLTGKSEKARNRLKDWDFKLGPNSVEAAIYVAWENEIKTLAEYTFIPESGKGIITSIQLKKLVDWIALPDDRFGPNPNQGRDQFLSEAFARGVEYLENMLGDDLNNWKYGQEKFKHTYMTHSLGEVVNEENRMKLDLGPLPRGGNSYTVNSTSGNNKQGSGASFRMIVNTGDWDAAIATNGPGQSGNPESPFYSNLFEPWAQDQYFPVYFSRSKIESVTVQKTFLNPKK